MSAYRSIRPLQAGDKVRIKKNKWGYAEEGDIGILQQQHHTMIGGRMVPAGWIIRVQWRWTVMRLLSFYFDLLFLQWWHFNCSHLFDNEFEVID